jgi:hypothetical protein
VIGDFGKKDLSPNPSPKERGVYTSRNHHNRSFLDVIFGHFFSFLSELSISKK